MFILHLYKRSSPKLKFDSMIIILDAELMSCLIVLMVFNDQTLQSKSRRVPTERYFYSMGPLIGIERNSTEIVIEIKQLYPGRMVSNPIIASKRRYMV